MYLTNLKLTDFKNYESANVDFHPEMNIIYGPNGSGKTNILDAIHFLSVSRSYFGLSDKHLIRNDNDYYRLEGNFTIGERNEQVVIKYRNNRKREIFVDLKKLAKVYELIGRYPLVLIAPDDIRIVKGASKDRRDYFNKWICQSDRSFLEQLLQYNRILRQKDALLKGTNPVHRMTVEAFNHKLIPLAININKRINQVLSSFSKNALEHYEAISQNGESISIKYLSDIEQEDVYNHFDQLVEAEISSRRTLAGIHRDDYEFMLEGKPLKKYGSQGQIKSWLYALRLAEYDYLSTSLSKRPLLMLDDFFEKLDRKRLSTLLDLISSDRFGQVFLTDTELERTSAILQNRGIIFDAFYVDSGMITKK